jgi:segregation and condensation protein B
MNDEPQGAPEEEATPVEVEVEVEVEAEVEVEVVAATGAAAAPAAEAQEAEEAAEAGEADGAGSAEEAGRSGAAGTAQEAAEAESSGRIEPDPLELSAAIEAVLVVAVDPVPPGLLAELLELRVEQVEQLCAALAEDYERSRRGFELARVAGGYRLQSRAALRSYVERFILDDQPQRLSAAALETLAIVAYKQPISRSQVAAIRGVNVDGVMRVLCQRGYVESVGRDDGPGQAVLFGTTAQFLERLGLDRIQDLPPLEQFVPDAGTVEALEHVLRTEPQA